MLIPNLRQLYTKAVQNWLGDNVPRLAAAFSFYAMLSLSPLLVLAVAIGSRLLGDSQAGQHVIHVAQAYIGGPGAKFLQSMIDSSAKPGASAVATLLSVAIAIYGATNLFQQLSDSVNTIWDAKSANAGIKGFLLNKIVAIAMFLAFAVVFVLWLGIDSWIGWARAHTYGFEGWELVSTAASVVFLTFVFAVSFRALPKGMVAWQDVWYGAVTTAVGFAISKYLLSLYFRYSTVSAAYGSAGALVIILLWIYYTAQIYFFGLELTCTYAHTHGSQRERKVGQQPIPIEQPKRTKKVGEDGGRRLTPDRRSPA